MLFGAPDESSCVHEIIRQIETSVGTVQREFALLAGVELVNRSQRGNQVFYQVNQKHPDYSELRALLAKPPGVFQLLKSVLTLSNPASILLSYTVRLRAARTRRRAILI